MLENNPKMHYYFHSLFNAFMPDQSTALVSTKPTESLVSVPWKRSNQGRHNLSGLRLRFVKAYERNLGNVSVTCHEIGIQRITFYRWMKSTTKVNVKFQQRLAAVQPEERHADALEFAHTQLVNKGDVTAVIFGLKAKGRHRGWNEKEPFSLLPAADVDAEKIEKIRAAITSRAMSRGVPFDEELEVYFGMFGATMPEDWKERLRG